MNEKLQITPSPNTSAVQPTYVQHGDDNVFISNNGTVNLTVNQQMPVPSNFSGNFYVPVTIDREYYNLFVLGVEEFDRPYFKIDRERALKEYMSEETKQIFSTPSDEAIARIKTLPSLFMAENRQYGKADDNQFAIYGFVSDMKIYETEMKIYYCGYRKDIPQQRINDIHEELEIPANKGYSELNRTHWAIKRVDLIQELLEAGIQIPVFNMQNRPQN